MDVATISMPREQALLAYRQYRASVRTVTDNGIMLGYKALARGKTIINPREAITRAGFDDLYRPRLAISRADFREQSFYVMNNEGRFEGKPGWRFPFAGGVAKEKQYSTYRAMVPLIPCHLRPGQTQLKRYWILWEADWKEAPRDPMLLKHLAGDLYVVLAVWDLTDLERAAMGVLRQ